MAANEDVTGPAYHQLPGTRGAPVALSPHVQLLHLPLVSSPQPSIF